MALVDRIIDDINDSEILKKAENKDPKELKKHKKQIIFKVDDNDHRLIKSMALQRRVSMRTLIIDAIAELIRKDIEVL